MLEFLPDDVEYVGVDYDPDYIKSGRIRFRGRGTFICADITSYEPSTIVDVVIAYGVLHHLDDEGVRATCRVATQALRPGGRVLFAEPTRTEDAGRLARAMIDHDRGRYVRAPESYASLMRGDFPEVTRELVSHGYRLPYTFVVLEAER
jgi:SAM-dependent methyltransferase